MSLRSRAIWVGTIAVLGILLAYPSMFTEEERRESDWISDRGLNLGLDLQGGVHWLLRIDQETAIRQELERVERDAKAGLNERNIPFAAVRVDESGVVELRGVARPDAERVIDETPLSNVELIEREGTLALRLTDDWIGYTVTRGVDQALEVLRRRIDLGGVREPVIAAQGEGRILVQLPGEIDPKVAREFISATTFLEFYAVLEQAPTPELLEAQYPDGLPEDTKIVESVAEDGTVTEALLVPKQPVLTGDLLRDARIGVDRRNRPLVQFEWDSEGTVLFREYTRENIGKRMAIVIDEEVISAPVIRSAIGRNGQIEGNFSQEEAANLAVSLRSGALPIPLEIEEERTVGPALGQDSIDQGFRSIVIGGLLVIAFMIVYYRTPGLLATVALVLNIVLIIGMMSFAGATLTLPGIAGLVLTVGMAVDANVIIFERIREELRRGKVIRTAIAEGFNRSRLTILDANITTLLTALILYYFGRGPVQGFGVTLAVGIVSSVFCALFVTRLLVELMLARGEGTLKF